MNRLIVAEKPSVALRVAMSISDSRPVRKAINGVTYFEIDEANEKIFVVAAAGHLFTISQSGSETKLPIFDVTWVPSYKINKYAYFTKKYLDTIAIVGKQCTEFINACDYDIEGTVIGTNIIRYVSKNDVNAKIDDMNVKRMKFSTTTNSDLLYAYKNIEGFDRNNFNAGETRHMLDWMWGINLSRALMRALGKKGIKKTLSIGRVQGPTLGILAKRDIEIKNFKPKDFWQIFAEIKNTTFANTRGQIFDEKLADEIAEKSKGKPAIIESVEMSQNELWPFPPFDLTSLQLEASKVLRLDPSRTLAIAQSLYEKSYVSYPRTASQKLPRTLNLPRIINEISKNGRYAELAGELIRENRFTPREGKKEDEAHPAIFPTGVTPNKLAKEEDSVYDLIVRRFLSVFARPARSEHIKVFASIEGEKYAAEGSKVVDQGWLRFYHYYKPKEASISQFDKEEHVAAVNVSKSKSKTEPPDRYTKASLIALLEDKNLGTKATRAEIIDTLFKRGYITGGRIEVTELGNSVYNALEKYAEEILDENMTRKLEEDMEQEQKGKIDEASVIGEGKNIITAIIKDFGKNENEIGRALQAGIKASEQASALGICLKDGGNLIVRHSKFGKSFVGCSNWPKCTNTYPLPGNAFVKPTGKVCEICHTPIVKVFRQGKVFQMDLDPNCPTKAEWGKKKEEKRENKPEKTAKQPEETHGAKTSTGIKMKAMAEALQKSAGTTETGAANAAKATEVATIKTSKAVKKEKIEVKKQATAKKPRKKASKKSKDEHVEPQFEDV